VLGASAVGVIAAAAAAPSLAPLGGKKVRIASLVSSRPLCFVRVCWFANCTNRFSVSYSCILSFLVFVCSVQVRAKTDDDDNWADTTLGDDLLPL
jgi:hypothetical protein